MSEYIYDWTPNKQHRKEEIVRCRDCRCKHDVDGRHLCVRWQFATELDGFCAWGERKEANE